MKVVIRFTFLKKINFIFLIQGVLNLIPHDDFSPVECTADLVPRSLVDVLHTGTDIRTIMGYKLGSV